MKRFFFLTMAVWLLCSGTAWAQSGMTVQVSGGVTDTDGQPIPGVSVMVEGTKTNTITDVNGKYTIPAPDDAVLVFSFMGMTTQQIQVARRTIIDVVLVSEAVTLDDVVVVAYGTVKRGGYTGAAVSVNAKTIDSRPITSITSVLEGVAPGIQVTSGSGQPGEGPSLRIRGLGSINASNNPLIVVDGFPYNGTLSDINQDDIESITLLKDASSSALYGSRAANGVLMVNTKKGKSGSLMVNVKTTQGISSRAFKEYPTVDAYQYVPIMWEAMRNALISGGRTPEAAAAKASNDIMSGTGLAFNPFSVANEQLMLPDGTMNPSAKLLYDDFDWEGALSRMGYRGEYNISANGGSDKVDYLFSAGHLKQQGYLIKTDFQRTTVRANVNITPKKWFKFGGNVSGAVVKSNVSNATAGSSSSYANAFAFFRSVGPIYPVWEHTADGSIKTNEKGKVPALVRPYGSGRHVVVETEWNDRYNDRNSLNSRAYVELRFLDGFKFTFNGGADISDYYGGVYENPTVGDGAPGGRSSKQYENITTWNFNQLLTYDRKFDGVHNVSLLAGHESFDYGYSYFRAMKGGVIMEGNPELVNFTDISNLSSYKDKRATEGYLFRANYDYDDKYYFSGSFRRDGSSRFHNDVRWGNFWSVGASWRIEKEAFFKSITWVDMLKLRAAYGETGNDAILDAGGYSSYYPWQSLYDISRNANEPGFVRSTSAGNKELTWEKSSNFDIALEFAAFNHRLNGTIEFFNRVSSNLLFNVPQPQSSGLENQPRNIGTMYNRGIEIQLAGDVIKGKDFTWNMNFNFTHFTNEITKMPDGQAEIISGTKKLMEGHSMYDYWLRTFVGVNPGNGAVMYKFKEEGASESAKAAAYDYKGTKVTEDQNNALYEYHNSAIPACYGGLTNTFTYRNLSLSFLLTYQLGSKVYDSNYGGLMSVGTYGYGLHTDIDKRWRKPGDVTDVPRMDQSKTAAYNGASSRWLIDGSYLSFKSVTLSYRLPATLVNKIDLSAVQVYFNAENLLLLTKRQGLNPTQQFNGTVANVYEPSRILTLGLNVSF